MGLSAISLWEMALLGERGRISAFSAQARWLEQIETDVHLFVYPITAAIASDAARLPESFPRDPADRIIAATARCESLELATADERIRQSRLVDVV